MIVADAPLNIKTLLFTFKWRICLTWLLTLCETVLMSLIPLLIGFAIDGLLDDDLTDLFRLSAVLAGLIVISVIRRIYDTRAYGTIRVELGRELAKRSGHISVSSLNARLDMARELVDFLETEAPSLMNSLVQLVVSLVILFSFHPALSYSALIAAIVMIAIYGVFHGRFFRLNGEHNHQTEQQVGILETKSPHRLSSHLMRLRRIEVRISDTEAYVYGAIFAVMLGFIIVNLWLSATYVDTTVGVIFSIISYSWEFVESALVLPATLQGWSRLSEIIERINRSEGHLTAESSS